jgi:hypothetical protein
MLKRVLVVLVVCLLLLLNAAAIAASANVTWGETLASADVYTSRPVKDTGYFSNNSEANNATSIKILGETQFVVTVSPSTAQCDSPSGCANTEVPVPTSAWLFASALGFLCIIRRRLHR